MANDNLDVLARTQRILQHRRSRRALGLAAAPAARTGRTGGARLAGAGTGHCADALPLARDDRGRPRLGGRLAGWDCSWSHSGDGLLIALGEGVQVGVDCERLRPRPRALELAQRFFTAPEHDWLAAPSAAVRDRAFLRLWCAKEAVLKAHGHGLSFGLDRLRFGEDNAALASGRVRSGARDAARMVAARIGAGAGYLARAGVAAAAGGETSARWAGSRERQNARPEHCRASAILRAG